MIETAHKELINGLTTKKEHVINSNFSRNEHCSLSYKCKTYNSAPKMGEIYFNVELKEFEVIDEKASSITSRDNVSDNLNGNDIGLNTTSFINDFVMDQMIEDKMCSPINNSHIEDEVLTNTSKSKNTRCKIFKENVTGTISKSLNNIIRKKRGRPKTGKSLLTAEKRVEGQEPLKSKIKEYDAEIAKYMELYCDICNSKSENFPALKVHMRNIHDIKEGYVTCCDKKFNKRALLLYHIRQHLNPNCYR